MQTDMINEQVKINNQDKESLVLTKIQFLEKKVCTSAYVQFLLRDVSVYTCMCVHECVHKSLPVCL